MCSHVQTGRLCNTSTLIDGCPAVCQSWKRHFNTNFVSVTTLAISNEMESVDISWAIPHDPHHHVGLGEPFTIKVTVTNETNKQLPDDTRFHIHGDNYFRGGSTYVGSVPAYGETTVTVTIKCHGGREPRHIQARTSYTLKSVSAGKEFICGRFLNTGATDVLGRVFAQELAKFQAPQQDTKLNILCFGMMGAGKSSFIQTVQSMLKDDKSIRNHSTVVGGTAAHGTTTLRQHDLKGLNW